MLHHARPLHHGAHGGTTPTFLTAELTGGAEGHGVIQLLGGKTHATRISAWRAVVTQVFVVLRGPQVVLRELRGEKGPVELRGEKGPVELRGEKGSRATRISDDDEIHLRLLRRHDEGLAVDVGVD